MGTDTIQRQYLTAQAILAADDIPTEDVEVPEWGGAVRMRGLTLGEVMDVRKAAEGDERQVVIHTLAVALVQPPMTLAEAEALLSKSGAVVQRLMLRITALNQVAPDGTPEVVQAQRRFSGGPGGQAGTAPGA